jgi:hypothetical protein
MFSGNMSIIIATVITIAFSVFSLAGSGIAGYLNPHRSVSNHIVVCLPSYVLL